MSYTNIFIVFGIYIKYYTGQICNKTTKWLKNLRNSKIGCF